MTTLKDLTEEIVAFRDKRDWEQFHNPKELSAAISIEAAELQELFLWKEGMGTEVVFKSADGHAAVQQEIADILIFALLFCNSADIDPAEAVREKLKHNANKYPVDLSRGRADKYTELNGSE